MTPTFPATITNLVAQPVGYALELTLQRHERMRVLWIFPLSASLINSQVPPAKARRACGRTPPHLSVPMPPCCFGFIVRHTGDTRQLPRADPVLPNQQRSQTDISGPDQVSVQRELAVLTDKEQAVLGAIRAAGMATAWAGLTGVVGIHPDTHEALQRGFIGDQLAEFGKRPPGGMPVRAPLL